MTELRETKLPSRHHGSNRVHKEEDMLFEAEGHRLSTIAKMLESEGIFVSRRGVTKFLIQVKATGSITRQAGSGRPQHMHRKTR